MSVATKPSLPRETGAATYGQVTAYGATDETLVRNAVANAGLRSHERGPRWAHVVNALATGSTSAHALCRRFGFDPDEVIGSSCDVDCDSCGQQAPGHEMRRYDFCVICPGCWHELEQEGVAL